MGSGSLREEAAALGEMLSTAGLSSRQAMRMHLQVLGEMVQGLGSRSARHVMTRADLLAMEMLLHLSEGYRRRYRERKMPARQLVLPGFQSAAPPVFSHGL